MEILRIYTYNENCGQAGKVVSQEDIDNDDQHTNEGDDYSGDYSLWEGTREDIIGQAVLQIQRSPKMHGFREARNILEHLDAERDYEHLDDFFPECEGEGERDDNGDLGDEIIEDCFYGKTFDVCPYLLDINDTLFCHHPDNNG